jgi:hypothetical protein
MPDKSDSPKLFDILPSAEMRCALRHAMPEQTALSWHHIGDLNVTRGQIAVLDAGVCHPRHLPNEAKILPWPRPQAEIWLRLATPSEGSRTRVLAVFISAPGDTIAGESTGKLCDGPAMAIDSASALVGDYDRMLTDCSTGGPLSQVCIFCRGRGNPPRDQEVQPLANFLAQHGFPVRVETYATGRTGIAFSRGLTEEEVARANALLASAGSAATLSIEGSHTSGSISRALAAAPYVQLNGPAGPLLFAFETGFATAPTTGTVRRAGQTVELLLQLRSIVRSRVTRQVTDTIDGRFQAIGLCDD